MKLIYVKSGFAYFATTTENVTVEGIKGTYHSAGKYPYFEGEQTPTKQFSVNMGSLELAHPNTSLQSLLSGEVPYATEGKHKIVQGMDIKDFLKVIIACGGDMYEPIDCNLSNLILALFDDGYRVDELELLRGEVSDGRIMIIISTHMDDNKIVWYDDREKRDKDYTNAKNLYGLV